MPFSPLSSCSWTRRGERRTDALAPDADAGLGGAPNLAHLHEGNPLGGRGANPHVTDAKLEQPKSRDELRSLQAQLNDDAPSRPGSSMEGSAGEL